MSHPTALTTSGPGPVSGSRRWPSQRTSMLENTFGAGSPTTSHPTERHRGCLPGPPQLHAAVRRGWPGGGGYLPSRGARCGAHGPHDAAHGRLRGHPADPGDGDDHWVPITIVSALSGEGDIVQGWRSPTTTWPSRCPSRSSPPASRPCAACSTCSCACRAPLEQVRAVANGVIDGIISADEDGTIPACEPLGLPHLGYTAAEMVGRNLRILMPEPHRSAPRRVSGSGATSTRREARGRPDPR